MGSWHAQGGSSGSSSGAGATSGEGWGVAVRLWSHSPWPEPSAEESGLENGDEARALKRPKPEPTPVDPGALSSGALPWEEAGAAGGLRNVTL